MLVLGYHCCYRSQLSPALAGILAQSELTQAFLQRLGLKRYFGTKASTNERIRTACNHIVCMHSSLCTQVTLCAQIGPACSPDSIDTLIPLIQPNLAKIYACAHKHIVCMHASFHAMVTLCAQTGPNMFSWFHRYFDLFDPTKFSWYIGLSMPQNSVHAC